MDLLKIQDHIVITLVVNAESQNALKLKIDTDNCEKRSPECVRSMWNGPQNMVGITLCQTG